MSLVYVHPVFRLIPSGVFTDKDISYSAVGLYCTIYDSSDDNLLPAHMDIKSEEFLVAKNELIDNGWLKISNKTVLGKETEIWQTAAHKWQFDDLQLPEEV